MRYKVGDILIITPPARADYAAEWLGVRCLIYNIEGTNYQTKVISKPPDPYKLGATLYWVDDEWVRLEKPLTPLEELIAAYVEAQKAELGI